MSFGTILLFTVIYGFLLLLIQRAEQKRRRLVAIILLPIIALFHWFANQRLLGSESNTALIAALILNFLFWFIVGRYNPVGSSDSIQVIGLDD